MRRALCLPILAATFLGAPAAWAQGGDLAAAQGAFDAAKKLVAEGKLAEACPKFLASFKVDPKPGTAVNLADCYEKTGQIASAWARYLEAAALAQRAGQGEREQYAKEHAAALESKLARLTIAAPAGAAGLEVFRDGAAVDPAFLGTPVPVDPGKHLIEVRAPGKKPWSKSVEIAVGSGNASVEIPVLEDAPPGTPVALPAGQGVLPPDQAAAGSAFPRKPVAFALIGVGAAGLIVGGITGGMAVGKHSSLASACPGGSCVNRESDIASYHTLGTVSTAGFVAGGVLAAAGVVFLVTAPKASAAKQAWVTPVVGPGFAGAVGRF